MNTNRPLTWNVDLHGDPPGSKVLKCPACLLEKSWYFEPFTPEEDREVAIWRLQAAFRIRAQLNSLPFHADRATRERKKCGSEMPYWLRLQGSQMTAQLPAPDASSIEGLTQEDLPDSFPFPWLRQVESLLLKRRQSTLLPKDGSNAA